MPVPKLRFKDDYGQRYPEWGKMKLGECTYIERGGSPRPINQYITDSSNGINWIKIGDAPLEGNVITSVKEKIKPEGASKSRKVIKGDLILSNSMSYGRPYLLAVDGCIHDGWLLIRNDKGVFDIRFLMQQLSSQYVKTQYDRLSNQGVVSNLNKELVKSVLIKIPSLPEQEKIADFLSSYDRMIEVQTKRVEAMKTRKKGLLQKIFSREIRFKDNQGQDYPEWKEDQLGNIAQITMGQSPDGSTYSNEPSKYILVQGNADLKNGWVCPRVWTTQKTKECQKGDIIMSVRAPAGAVGRTAYNAVIGRGVAAIKGNAFIYQALLKMDMDGFWKKYAAGSTFESLNSKDVKSAKLRFPSLPEQQKIADFLTAVDTQIEVEEKRLETMKTIKKGLLQQMFI